MDLSAGQQFGKEEFDKLLATLPAEQTFTWKSAEETANFGDWEKLETVTHPTHPSIKCLLRDTSAVSPAERDLIAQIHATDAGYMGSTSLDYVDDSLAPTVSGDVDRRLKPGDILEDPNGVEYRIIERVVTSGRSRVILLMIRETEWDTRLA